MEDDRLSALAPVFVPIASGQSFAPNEHQQDGRDHARTRSRNAKTDNIPDNYLSQPVDNSGQASARNRQRRRPQADSRNQDVSAAPESSTDQVQPSSQARTDSAAVSSEPHAPGPRSGRSRGRGGYHEHSTQYGGRYAGQGRSGNSWQRPRPDQGAEAPGLEGYGQVSGPAGASQSQVPTSLPSQQRMLQAPRDTSHRPQQQQVDVQSSAAERYQGQHEVTQQERVAHGRHPAGRGRGRARGGRSDAQPEAEARPADHWRTAGDGPETLPTGRGPVGAADGGRSRRGVAAGLRGRGPDRGRGYRRGADYTDVAGDGAVEGYAEEGGRRSMADGRGGDVAGGPGAENGPGSVGPYGGRGRRGGRSSGFATGHGHGRGGGFGGTPGRGARAAAAADSLDPTGGQKRGEDVASMAAAAGGSGSDSDSEARRLTCVVCCEEVTAVAVGACDHSHTCARCCLRLRLCYRDLRCPLCKAVNDEVVVARPPLPPGASFDSLAGTPQLREALWQQPRWAKGVLVCENLPAATGDAAAATATAAPSPARRGRPLHSSLVAMTSRSCSVCDRHGHRPFGSMGLLVAHLRAAHDRSLCEVCTGAGLKFPLEYPAYDAAGMAAHVASEHPRCEYCALPFYGRDELYAHMTQRHYTCHVCSRLGRHHLYFEDAQMLMVHLHADHYLCEHPDCAGCMMAFSSQEELNTHVRDLHSSFMPRWDQSRARPLLLEFITPRTGAGVSALMRAGAAGSSTSAAGGRQQGGRRGGRPDSDAEAAPAVNFPSSQRTPPRGRRGTLGPLADPEAFPSLGGVVGGALPAQAQAPPAGLGDVREAEGGLAVIDDDRGNLGAAEGAAGPGARRGPGAAAVPVGSSGAAAAAGPGGGPGTRLAGAWAGRQPGSGTFGEDFPQLATAAGGAAGGVPTRSAWGAAYGDPTASTSPTPGSAAGGPTGLRKVTVRCPCGRRLDHLALKPDEKAQPLRCDRDCVAAQRRTQLADAFGVASADTHVPYFDRHRTPNYSAELMQAALGLGVEWVASVERDLARFLADPSARRTSLAPGMSQAQRRLVHMLAEEYGLTTHSTGQGTARAVQVLRGASSGVPTRLLSAVTAATPPEELARLAASQPGGAGGASGWALRLVDVTPGANLQQYLRAWDGDYTLTPAQPSSSSAWGAPTSVLVTFSREAAFRDCCSRLGGGIRGVFRTVVERDRAAGAGPAGAAATAAPAAPVAAAPPPGWQVLRSKTGPVSSSSSAVPRKPATSQLAAPSAAVAAAGCGDVTEGGASAASTGGARSGACKGRGARGDDPTAAIRSALAADAWEAGDVAPSAPSKPLPRESAVQGASAAALAAGPGGFTALASAVAGPAAGTTVEPRLPGRGPPLNLAGKTLWSALQDEESQAEDGGGRGDSAEEGGGSQACEGTGATESRVGAAGPAAAGDRSEIDQGGEVLGYDGRPDAWDELVDDAER